MKKLITALCAIAILASSCGDKSASSTANKAATASTEKADLMRDKQAIEKAFTELREMPKYKGQKVMVFQNITFSPAHILIELSDAAKPENIDHYEYQDGKWSAAQPVQISGGGDMKDNLTDLDKIAVGKLAEMTAAADEKVKTVEGADKVKSTVFLLHVMNQVREFSYTIRGSREHYVMDFNADGSLKSYKKS